MLFVILETSDKGHRSGIRHAYYQKYLNSILNLIDIKPSNYLLSMIWPIYLPFSSQCNSFGRNKNRSMITMTTYCEYWRKYWKTAIWYIRCSGIVLKLCQSNFIFFTSKESKGKAGLTTNQYVRDNLVFPNLPKLALLAFLCNFKWK